MYWDRFDICEAYYALEYDYNQGGMLHERGRNYSVGVQLRRMRFKPRPSLSGRESLGENAQAIYDAAVERLGLPHECQWGELEHSRLAGTCHRKCQVPGCKISALDDDED